MYRPIDKLNPEYPVFKKVNGRIISFLSMKAFFACMAAVLVSIVLYVILGKVAYTETVAMDELERAESQNLYVAEWAALRMPEVEKALSQYTTSDGKAKSDLSAGQRQTYLEYANERAALEIKIAGGGGASLEDLAEAACRNGLTAQMYEGEAIALAPVTKEVRTPYLSSMVRFSIGLLIVGFTILLSIEPGGSRSLAKSLIDLRHFSKKQHVFVYRRSIEVQKGE